jgi:hypothetical protein
LHELVHARIREVFGDPSSTLERDDHWALMPDGLDIAPIHILVNGTAESPAVWVFDPHSRSDGVHRVAVKDEDELHKIIKHIEHRLQRASVKNNTGHK